MRSGAKWQWAPEFMLASDISGRTLGIFGSGRIGSNFAKKSVGFRMKVIYNDRERNEKFEQEAGATFVDKETLLREADFISLHVPLTSETRHLIGEKEFGMMKRSAVLINSAQPRAIIFAENFQKKVEPRQSQPDLFYK